MELEEIFDWNVTFNFSEPPPDFINFFDAPLVVKVTACIQGVIAAIGWIANLVVIGATLLWKERRSRGRMEHHFLIYVVHLSASNLVFLSTVPFKINEMIQLRWMLGHVSCRVVTLCTYVNFTVVALLLTIISIDRCLAAHQTNSRFRSRVAAKWATLVAWVVAFSGALPFALFHSAEENAKCSPQFPGQPEINESAFFDLNSSYFSANDVKCTFPSVEVAGLSIWILCNFFYSFLIPFLIICFCYGAIIYRVCRPRTSTPTNGKMARLFRRKVTTMSLLFVISYAVCYTPFYVWVACKLVGIPVKSVKTCFHVERFNTTMAYVNSALHPLVYIATNAHFRKFRARMGPSTGNLLRPMGTQQS
ncbi:unnamed protein product [Clavelina lepadiformis]|uniref:G-protein coupled receptors family 1 profile domain-containing protein n=1 Tax=Clavelina lepadiformis TaxID=159417 RepID=A0ABP0FC40_CLALP